MLHSLFSQNSVNEIGKIPLAQYQFHNARDSFKWIHHSSENFFVKSTYVAIALQSNPNNSSPIWKKI